jgi:hypothetical protein
VAGTRRLSSKRHWIPAVAGMTTARSGPSTIFRKLGDESPRVSGVNTC